MQDERCCRGSTSPWSRARVDCGIQIKLKSQRPGHTGRKALATKKPIQHHRLMHSQLTLLQHIMYSSLMTPQSTGWKMMEQCVFIHLTDGNLTIQLPGCVNEGFIQYPPSSKRKLETLFTMDLNRMMIQLLLPRPLGGLSISLAAGHPMIHHLDCETSCRCP